MTKYCVVNENLILFGFCIEVKGELKFYHIDKLNGYSDSLIEIRNRGIISKQTDALKNIPKVIAKESGSIELKTNDISISEVIKYSDKDTRYVVSVGKEYSVEVDNAIASVITRWFEPKNFSVSKSGNIIVFGHENVKVTYKYDPFENKKSSENTLHTNIDIIDICDYVREAGGSLVVKLPHEKYKTISDYGKVILDGFQPLDIGELASPKLEFNPKKLNINAGFKKVGFVQVGMNGIRVPIVSFVHRKKSLWAYGRNNMKRIGIAIERSKLSLLMERLKGLAIEVVMDEYVTGHIKNLIDAKDVEIVSIDISNVPLVSESKIESSILSNKEIMELMEQLSFAKVITKGIKYIIKESKANRQISEDKREICKMFSMMDSNGIKAVQESGIDIYTGAYNGEYKLVYNENPSEELIIEYKLYDNGLSKLTGKKIVENVICRDTSVLPQSIIDYIGAVMSKVNVNDRLREAYIRNSKAEKWIEDINKKLWIHNAAMYSKGNYTKIHCHNKETWEFRGISNKDGVQHFECVESGAYGLQLDLCSVTI